MSVSVTRLELGSFASLPHHTRKCVFWEVEPVAQTSRGTAPGPGDLEPYESEFDKEAWISGLLLDWGACGQVAIESSTNTVIGTAFYAPPNRVPRSQHFPTSPVSHDAVLLTSIRTEPGHDEVATILLDAVLGDLIRRGVRAVESFGLVRNGSGADPFVLAGSAGKAGAAVVLALAQTLAQESLPFTVRFIGFGSEELGLIGSRRYVASLSEEEIDGIIAMFNFDALGSGRQASVLGDIELTTLAIEQADAMGISVRAGGGLQRRGSDHMNFSQADIPVLMFYAPDFSRIHTASDKLEFVNPALLGDAAELALAMLRSPDFLKVLD